MTRGKCIVANNERQGEQNEICRKTLPIKRKIKRDINYEFDSIRHDWYF